MAVLKVINYAFSHLHLKEESITLASLGSVDRDHGVQPRKIMKRANGAFVVKNAQHKVKDMRGYRGIVGKN